MDGGSVVRASSGSGKSGIYMVAPAYQFIANGLFEAIWGVSISANLVARQGYAEPFFQSNVPTGDPLGRKTVLLVNNVDDFRLPRSPRWTRAPRRSSCSAARSSPSTSMCSTC